MKKLPLILSVVSFIAVLVLYILYFTGGKSHRASGITTGQMAGTDAAGGDIVFIDIDSVLNNYRCILTTTMNLKEKQKYRKPSLSSKQKIYQKDVNDYQYKMERGLITRAEDQQIQQQLYNQQQTLLKLQQDKQTGTCRTGTGDRQPGAQKYYGLSQGGPAQIQLPLCICQPAGRRKHFLRQYQSGYYQGNNTGP